MTFAIHSFVVLFTIYVCVSLVVGQESTCIVAVNGTTSVACGGSDQDFCRTIDACLKQYSSGLLDIVLIEGVYSGEGNCHLNISVSPVTITGEEGVIIDCQNSTRHATVYVGGEVTYESITFKNGYGLGNGGSLLVVGGTVTVKNSLFQGNHATENGGAISSSELDHLNLVGVSFVDNMAKLGGAVSALYTLVIDSCSFHNNTASQDGGAIYAEDVSIINSELILNQALGEKGGAVYSRITNIVDTRFLSNEAVDGGAVYAFSSAYQQGVLFSSNGTFSYNTVSGQGGAIFIEQGIEVTLLDSVISQNVAYFGAGIFWNVSTETSINPKAWTNTILSLNLAFKIVGQGGGIFLHLSENVDKNFTIRGLLATGNDIVCSEATIPFCYRSSPCLLESCEHCNGTCLITGTNSTRKYDCLDSVTPGCVNGHCEYSHEHNSTAIVVECKCTGDYTGALCDQSPAPELKPDDHRALIIGLSVAGAVILIAAGVVGFKMYMRFHNYQKITA